ncbi:MAG: hypothetical protein ACRDWD_08920 [Acidimicrobiia bacterium]
MGVRHRGEELGATQPFVLYGGLSGGNPRSLADTWRLLPDGNGGYEWEHVCNHCPPGRRAFGAIAACGEDVVVIGGRDIDTSAPQPELTLSDTWRARDGEWRLVDAGVAPTASTDDPAVPYNPLLASLPSGALLAENHFDVSGGAIVTRSFVLSCATAVPIPPVRTAPVPVEPTFTG